MPLLDPALLEVLVCPQCHGDLQPDEAASTLNCTNCKLAFPIEDGIPIMLVEEARATATSDE